MLLESIAERIESSNLSEGTNKLAINYSELILDILGCMWTLKSIGRGTSNPTIFYKYDENLNETDEVDSLVYSLFYHIGNNNCGCFIMLELPGYIEEPREYIKDYYNSTYADHYIDKNKGTRLPPKV